MGVELYFVKPTADGRIVFPAWDERGDPLPGVEYERVSSLKWAQGDRRLGDFGLLGPELIPPSQLRAGAEGALKALLAEIAALDPHYRWMAEDAGDDLERIALYLSAFVTGADWVLGEPDAQRAAFALAEEFFGAFELLFSILKYSKAGYWGRWSY